MVNGLPDAMRVLEILRKAPPSAPDRHRPRAARSAGSSEAGRHRHARRSETPRRSCNMQTAQPRRDGLIGSADCARTFLLICIPAVAETSWGTSPDRNGDFYPQGLVLT
jgi:hypothetical protein